MVYDTLMRQPDLHVSLLMRYLSDGVSIVSQDRVRLRNTILYVSETYERKSKPCSS
jgi:hypothetical protein